MAPILIIDPGHGGMDPGGRTNQHQAAVRQVTSLMFSFGGNE